MRLSVPLVIRWKRKARDFQTLKRNVWGRWNQGGPPAVASGLLFSKRTVPIVFEKPHWSNSVREMWNRWVTEENLDVRWHTAKKQSGIWQKTEDAMLVRFLFEAVKRLFVEKWLKLRLHSSIRSEGHKTEGKAMFSDSILFYWQIPYREREREREKKGDFSPYFVF